MIGKLPGRVGGWAAAVLAAMLMLGVAPRATAQAAGERRCELEFEKLRDSTTTLLLRQPSGKYNAFQGGGVRYRCKGQDMTMDADSAAYYGDLAILYLVGQVHYRDEKATLDANQITYYQNEEWVVADGNVSARMANGSTMRGPTAQYFRIIPDVRPTERLLATGRPHFQLQQRDSSGKEQPPTDVVADRVTAEGDSLVFAGGAVDIRRVDLTASSDSAMLDESAEFGRLVRNARVVGTGERGYTLTGTIIDLFSKERELERVLSMGSARAVSEDVIASADTLDMRMMDGRIEHAYAWGPGRAHVEAPGRDMMADSLEVTLANQRLLQLFAVGDARLESEADTLKIRTDERDWLVGDTVIANFDSTTAPQADSQPVLREVLAFGNARSFQQIPPDSGVTEKPSIHYVIGRDIKVAFDSGAVQRVTVIAPDSGQTVGVYLDASGRSSPVDAGGRPGDAPARPAATTTPPRRPPSSPARPAGVPPGDTTSGHGGRHE